MRALYDTGASLTISISYQGIAMPQRRAKTGSRAATSGYPIRQYIILPQNCGRSLSDNL